MKQLTSLLLVFLAFQLNINAQNIETSETDPAYYVNEILLGDYVSVSNIISTCSSVSLGEFQNFAETSITIDSGIILSTGNVNDILNPAGFHCSSATNTGSDSDLSELVSNSNISDAAILEFDYIPYTNELNFDYVFGSEEFPEYVGQFNDVFGFFVSGPGIESNTGFEFINNAKNIALIPNTGLFVSINNIFDTEYYIDNSGSNTIAMDGITSVLTASVSVIPFETYHFKIAIGDTQDAAYDSKVLLKKNSLKCEPINFTVEGAIPNESDSYVIIEDENILTITATLPTPAIADFIYPYTLSGTADNGIDYEILNDFLYFQEGESTAEIQIKAICDGIDDDLETVILNFEYIDIEILVEIQNSSDCSISTSCNTTDSLALVALYETNGGENWNNNSNWLESKVEDWYGITIENNRVVTIMLIENSLTGNITSEVTNLSALESLQLSYNEIESLPEGLPILGQLKTINLDYNLLNVFPNSLFNTTSLETLRISFNNFESLPIELLDIETLNLLDIKGNYLTFGDIEPLVGINGLSYSYQHPIGEEQSYLNTLGTDIEFSIITDGENNIYNWYLNDNLIPNENNSILSIENISWDDEGEYICRITNSIANDLTLFIEPIQLTVDFDITIEENQNSLNIYPNPTNGTINIKTNSNIKSIEILDLKGAQIMKFENNNRQIDVSELDNGLYIIKVEYDNNVELIKFSKI